MRLTMFPTISTLILGLWTTLRSHRRLSQYLQLPQDHTPATDPVQSGIGSSTDLVVSGPGHISVTTNDDEAPDIWLQLQPTSISKKAFNGLRALYIYHICDMYRSLGWLRSVTISKELELRSPPFLTKDEVVSLTRWVRRVPGDPVLLDDRGSAEDNDETVVRKVTEEAFLLYRKEDPFPSINTLVKLKGIEAYHASLLLSTLYRRTMPFLSEELCRWTTLNDPVDRININDYLEVCYPVVQAVTRRLQVSAADVERVALVLMHQKDVAGKFSSSYFRGFDSTK